MSDRDAEVMRLARQWATPEYDAHDPLDCPCENVEPGTICMQCALAVMADALLDRDRQLRDLQKKVARASNYLCDEDATLEEAVYKVVAILDKALAASGTTSD